MRSHARVTLLALLMGVLITGLLATAAQAAPEIANFFAANCKVNTCEKKLGETEAEELAKAKVEGFTQAGGHPNFGITDFTVNTFEITTEAGKVKIPVGTVEHVRTDVAPGVSTNPETVPKCSQAKGEFGTNYFGSGLFTKATCAASTELGVNKVVVVAANAKGEPIDLPLEGKVFNLEQEEGLASEFGVALPLPIPLTKALLEEGGLPEELAGEQLYAHTIIKGNVEWGIEAAGTGQADYHDFFEIEVSTLLKLISSRLVFNGRADNKPFLTNPTSCTGVGPQTTTTLSVTFKGEGTVKEGYETKLGNEGCKGEAGFEVLPFAPAFSLTQESEAAEATDGVLTTLSEPHDEDVTKVDSSQVENTTIALPPGLTLNAAAGGGLEGCKPSEFGVNAAGKALSQAIKCPTGSRIGEVSLNVPGLPNGSLTGFAYLGEPESSLIEGPPYTIYVGAESKFFHVVVRLIGQTTPDEKTGQLTTMFAKTPEQPFTELKVKFNTGPFAPLANGLTCEEAKAVAAFTPYSGTANHLEESPFKISGCPATTPFALSQGTENEKATGGGFTSYALKLERPTGQQYLEKIKTTLPEGLLGAIPSVTPCEGVAAETGKCTASSRIGTATVKSGAGGIPATFEGPVYFTGPYNGAPYGLSIAVPAKIGPFELGTVVTRSTININPTTSRVTAESVVPQIFKGVPLRIRSINVAITKQGYLYNPTSCTPGETETTLTSVGGAATQELKSPFPLTGCEALSFTPVLKASTNAKFSKKTGAAMTTTITQTPGQANIKSVKVQLPIQLPSRQETLNKACLAAVFEANLANCPAGSKVGSASVTTPTLPGELKGPAYLVSHGGEKFPDLDLVLEDKGVKIILVGHTNIKNGVTTSTFESDPDAPISKVTVSLPAGTGSLLGANGDLCRKALVMPTTITGQNGKVVKQNTIVSISGCGVKIVGHKVVGNSVILTVKTFAAGRISGSGTGLKAVSRKLAKATNTASLTIPLSSKGRGKRKPFKSTVRVGFVPSAKGGAHSASTVKVTFH